MNGRAPEIRIGLVLYGGVSLAVYIYGVVVEVQRLLAAGAELESHRLNGGDPAELSAYARALDAASVSKVAVDLISGTSAGGINGILLAKALARGTDVAAVRDLWVEQGDIGLLLQPDEEDEPRALLWSDHFTSKLLEGLELLDGQADATAPSPGALDLFVSSTHLRGGARRFSDSLGQSVDTRQHRYVFRRLLRRKLRLGDRTQGYERDDFGPGENDRLAKLARATSAFPVAFEPVEITKGDDLLNPAEEADGWFADGGILNNKPFSEALETIFSRASDRPVRRWLLSIDPDPVAVAAEDGAGSQPAFDRIALRAVSSIPRYQSIARDLAALQAHNERVDASEEIVVRLEVELAEAREVEPGAREGPGAEARPLGPGLLAAYRTLSRQAWSLEIASALSAAVREDDAGRVGVENEAASLDRVELHRRLRVLAEDVVGGAYGPAGDLAFQRRRIYYLIKLLGLADAVVVAGKPDPAYADRLRELLWAEFEAIADSLWSRLGRPDVWAEPGGVADRLGHLSGDELLAAIGSFTEVSRQSAADLHEPLAAAHLLLSRPGRPGEDQIEVRLADVFSTFPRRDAGLLAAEVYGDLRWRDRVNHAQVSPVRATNTGVAAASKLAGDSLGHFGGFLDRGWRENDLLWGRLDGAEALMRIVLEGGGVERAQAAELLDAVQMEILEQDLPDVLAGPAPWKEALKDHMGAGPSPADLDRRDLAATGLRSASILRRMLRTAANDADSSTLLGGARAAALRAGAIALAGVLSIVYLPAKLLLRGRR